MRRRIIAALSAAALAATVCIGSGTAASAVEPGVPYVALGDSEAAGTGNLPHVDQQCLRSKKAYPVVLAAALGTPHVSAACSGAKTGSLADQRPNDVLDQVATLAANGSLGPGTQLVTLTAGINNLGWQDVLLACSQAGDFAACQQQIALAQAALAALPTDLGGVLGAIRGVAPNALILVTDYPLLFGMTADSCSVGAYQGTPVKFNQTQIEFVNGALIGLSQVIQQTVAGYALATGDPGVQFVGVIQGFAGHGLCDTGDRWISGLVSGKPVFDRSLHPNTPGQQAYAAIIGAAIP